MSFWFPSVRQNVSTKTKDITLKGYTIGHQCIQVQLTDLLSYGLYQYDVFISLLLLLSYVLYQYDVFISLLPLLSYVLYQYEVFISRLPVLCLLRGKTYRVSAKQRSCAIGDWYINRSFKVDGFNFG